MTKFTQPITINADGKHVVFNGVDFSGLALINIANAASITITNCRIYGITGDNSTNKFWLKISGDFPTRLIIERNFFGNNTGIYNLLELGCKLGTGSSISYNYFKDGACTHNYVGLYGAQDNATIDINCNYLETSKDGGIRLGVKNDVICKFNINNNKIETETTPGSEWAGLICMQPFGKVTTSMKGWTLYMSNNTVPGEQLIYAYYGSNDLVLTADNIPTLYVNKVKADYPIRH